MDHAGGSECVQARAALEGGRQEAERDAVSAPEDKKVMGGSVLAGCLPSRSGSFATAEQPCRHPFVHRRQVLGRADAGCGNVPARAMSRVWRGEPSGRGTVRIGGARTSQATGARAPSARLRPAGGRASGTPLPLSPLQGDGHRASAWRDAGETLQRKRDRAGLRDVRPGGGDHRGDARTRLAVALRRAGVAGDVPMAGSNRAGGDLRDRAALAAGMVSSPASRAGGHERPGHGARRRVGDGSHFPGRRASCVCVTVPSSGAQSRSTSLDRIGRGAGCDWIGAAPARDGPRARRGKADSGFHGFDHPQGSR